MTAEADRLAWPQTESEWAREQMKRKLDEAWLEVRAR